MIDTFQVCAQIMTCPSYHSQWWIGGGGGGGGGGGRGGGPSSQNSWHNYTQTTFKIELYVQAPDWLHI